MGTNCYFNLEENITSVSLLAVGFAKESQQGPKLDSTLSEITCYSKKSVNERVSEGSAYL